MSIEVEGVRIAYGRMGRAEREALYQRSQGSVPPAVTMYRIIVCGVPGPFTVGQTNYVVAHTGDGPSPWTIYTYQTGWWLGRWFPTRDAATNWLFSDYGVSPETHAMIAAAKEERDD